MSKSPSLVTLALHQTSKTRVLIGCTMMDGPMTSCPGFNLHRQEGVKQRLGLYRLACFLL